MKERRVCGFENVRYPTASVIAAPTGNQTGLALETSEGVVQSRAGLEHNKMRESIAERLETRRSPERYNWIDGQVGQSVGTRSSPAQWEVVVAQVVSPMIDGEAKTTKGETSERTRYSVPRRKFIFYRLLLLLFSPIYPTSPLEPVSCWHFWRGVRFMIGKSALSIPQSIISRHLMIFI